MPKRKSNLSRNTRKAISQRLQRQNESQQDRERRLLNCRLRMSECRSKKRSSEKNVRLLLDKARHSSLRARENLKSRDQLLEIVRIRHTIPQSLVSEDSEGHRFEYYRMRYAIPHTLESYNSIQHCFEDYRIRHVITQNLDSYDSREHRLEDDRVQRAIPQKKSSLSAVDITTEVHVKDEPDWDASSIEEEETSIAEMFHAEMTVKSEPGDDMDIEEEGLMYSPLACELCAEVFTVPGAWVRHVQGHAHSDQSQLRKRKSRSASDDTEETMALLRCDLCQKHFPNPAEWVRHIQSTHTESELAISNNSAPPKRHNRFTEGAQNKTCSHCKKIFPSHASMLIHLRTHTGERPFVCGLCNKGFNVKSNLLRHLRTLHDQMMPREEPDEPGPSEVKRES